MAATLWLRPDASGRRFASKVCRAPVDRGAVMLLALQVVRFYRRRGVGYLDCQPLTLNTAESHYGIRCCGVCAWISAIVRSYDKEALRRNEASQEYAEKGTLRHMVVVRIMAMASQNPCSSTSLNWAHS